MNTTLNAHDGSTIDWLGELSGLGVAELIVLLVVAYIFLSLHIGVALALAAAGAVHLVLVPQLFEYSRVIWAHVVAASESESHPLPPPPGDC